MEDMKLNTKLSILCGSKISRRRVFEEVNAHRPEPISMSTINNWFNGVHPPDLQAALAIARLLKVPLDFLADDSQDIVPEPVADQTEIVLLETLRLTGIEPPQVLGILIRAGALTQRDLDSLRWQKAVTNLELRKEAREGRRASLAELEQDMRARLKRRHRYRDHPITRKNQITPVDATPEGTKVPEPKPSRRKAKGDDERADATKPPRKID